MYTYLVGDIGGTNARFTLMRTDNLDSEKRAEIVFRKDYQTLQFSGASDVITDFLSVAQSSTTCLSPNSCELAVLCCAGPVEDIGICKMTNAPWIVASSEIIEKTQLKYVHIQNDFKSVGYGVLHLREAETLTINEAALIPRKVIGVLGAGTGLGECYVTFDDEGDREVRSSEGGHTDMPIRNLEDFCLYRFMLKRVHALPYTLDRALPGFDFVSSSEVEKRLSASGLDSKNFGLLGFSEKYPPHISCERVVCGSGLEHLYDFYEMEWKLHNGKISGREETPLVEKGSASSEKSSVYCLKRCSKVLDEVDKCRESGQSIAKIITKYCWKSRHSRMCVKEAEDEGIRISPGSYFSYGTVGGDIVCYLAVRKFLQLYAAQAGNMALTLLPKGGLYIAGGIFVKILKVCSEEEKNEMLSFFRENFLEKGRMKKLLVKIPLKVVLIEEVGLLGASYVGKRYLKKWNVRS